MKYASIIFFALALGWTWSVVHSSPEITFETHAGIQEKMAYIIKQTIETKKPGSTDIIIEKVWTEAISDGKVKVFFIYSYKFPSESGVISNRIQGNGLLQRGDEDSSSGNHWTLSKVQVINDTIEFDEATLVTGNPNSSESKSEEAPQESESSPNSQSEEPKH